MVNIIVQQCLDKFFIVSIIDKQCFENLSRVNVSVMGEVFQD